ncbi:biogenesis of lysosome-related organelles complex 1 subunit 4 [Saimiri boliviensis]|uniref:biogenesis of lysosome-related organelles complex 1 subunit 4 n=1 Tax=Saimiri boliviensis TaxID=27679 RepID=UPI003D787AF4
MVKPSLLKIQKLGRRCAAGRSRATEGRSPEGPEEEAEPQRAWSGDSGTVSQSHSSASGRGRTRAEDGAPGDAACLLPGAGARPEVEALDASLEDLLTRVDEFVGMPDMLRGDSSHVVREGVPRIHAEAAEMRRIYSRIDRLEAFVRMVGGRVARMEEQVTQAEAELGAFPRAFKKLLHTMSVSSLFSKSSSSRPQRAGYEAPVLFRTEDYFPCSEMPQLGRLTAAAKGPQPGAHLQCAGRCRWCSWTSVMLECGVLNFTVHRLSLVYS